LAGHSPGLLCLRSWPRLDFAQTKAGAMDSDQWVVKDEPQ
jgi:hypothetical protein